jgi:hypothetical protein
MTLAHQSLYLLVLLITGTVSALPMALRETRPHVSALPRSRVPASDLWIVQSARGGWFINGTSRSSADLERFLRHEAQPRWIRYLPSDALPSGRVSHSLRWLRDLTSAPVVLELTPERP